MMQSMQLMMPFRRAMSPINSIKHIIDAEGTLLAVGTQVEVPVVVAVPNVDSAVFSPGDVRVGGKVNGIFFSVFIIGESGAGIGPGSINWHVSKMHTSQVPPTAGNTGTSSLRNQIIHEEKGLAGSQDGTPMAFKGVIVIPRGMRRMREGDRVILSLRLTAAATADALFCVKAIYKSFF